MAHRRVVVTGLGIVAPNGIGKEQFWRNLVAGESAVERVFSFNASQFPSQVAAEVRDFSATDFVSPRKAKAMGRFRNSPWRQRVWRWRMPSSQSRCKSRNKSVSPTEHPLRELPTWRRKCSEGSGAPECTAFRPPP